MRETFLFFLYTNFCFFLTNNKNRFFLFLFYIWCSSLTEKKWQITLLDEVNILHMFVINKYYFYLNCIGADDDDDIYVRMRV